MPHLHCPARAFRRSILILSLAFLAVPSARAATFPVNGTDDTGDADDYRGAVGQIAANGDVVQFNVTSVTLNGASADVNPPNFSFTLDNNGNAVSLDGNGLAILNNGATAINVTMIGAGSFSLTDTQINLSTGTLTVSGTDLDLIATPPTGGFIADTTRVVLQGAGDTLDLNGNNEQIASIASNDAASVVQLDAGTLTVGAASSTFAGQIAGSGSVVKSTGGTTLTLTGNSNFTGGIALQGGAIAVGTSNTALGTGTLTFSTAAGNRLVFNDDRTLANNVSLAADGTVEVTSGTSTLTGVISGTANTNDLTKSGAGTLVLSGANTYDGQTSVAAGELRLGANNVIFDTSVVAISSGATLALNTFSDTVAGLSSAATDSVVNLGTGVLTVNTAAASSFAGILADSGAANDGALVKSGTATMTLSGNSTYAGGTDLQNGAIQVSTNNTALGTGALTFSTNANNSLIFGGSVSLANAVVLNEDGIVNTGASAGTIGGAISGAAANSLIKTGSGTLTLGGATNSTYAGGTDLRAGVLAVQTNNTALGTGTLTFSTADNNQLLFSSNNLNLGNNVVLDQDGIVNTGANAGQLSGVISGSGDDHLAKTGTGTLVLSGANAAFLGGVEIRGGTVQVLTNDNALGTGTLTFNTAAGNTLQFGESGRNVGNAITLTTAGNVDTQGFNATLSSLITGAGANGLTKLGTGTLTMTGAQTGFASGLTLANGAVSIASADNIGTGRLTFNDTGDDALLLLNSAMTLSNQIAVTEGATFNTGGFNQTLSGTFVAGTGNLVRMGAGTVTITAANSTAFNGTFTAAAGATMLNGAVLGQNGAGNMSVLAAAALGGTGTIGGTLSNAGFLRPGFSAGTMTVQGDFNQTAAGTYDAEINADGTSDLVDATGNANLDGTLNLIGQNDQQGSYFGRTFTVVEADGTINGAFATIADNLDLLDPTVTVDNSNATSKVLVSFNSFSTTLDRFGTNENQRAVGAALNQTFVNGEAGTDLRAAISQFLVLSPEGKALVLQQLAGEGRTASMTTAINNNSLSNTRLAGQMGSLRNIFGRHARPRTSSVENEDGTRVASAPRSARLGFGSSVAGFGVEGSMSSLGLGNYGYEDWEEELPEDQVWVLGTGQWGDLDPTAENQGFDYDGQGFLLGHTWEVSDNVLVGAHVGYNSNEINVVGGLDKTDLESFNLGAHATYYHDGDYLDGVIGITNDEFDTQRFIQFGTIDRVASGDFDADQHYLYLEAGRTYVLGDDEDQDGEQLHVQPQLALQYRNYTQDAYSETGADDLNLTVLENDLDMFQTGLGARFFYNFITEEGGQIVPDLMIRWAHEHGDIDRTARSQFVGSSTVFAVNGIKQDRDSVQVRAGVTAATMDDFSVDVSYNGELASKQNNHAGVLRLVWRY